MIDLTQEQLVALSQVPKVLPKRPNGKRLHISAVYRWVQRGRKGHRLETIKIGGTTYTSIEALQRFSSPDTPSKTVPKPRTRMQPQQAKNVAEKLLSVDNPAD